jgi:transcriptional repressor NrdR
MQCPKCKNKDTKVLDSRTTNNDKSIRRRRQCNKCEFRFSTIEEIKILDLAVEKRNGRVEPFSEDKLTRGVRRAFNKRNIDQVKIDTIVQKIIDEVIKLDKSPIKATKLGRIVLKVLKQLDEAAYISFWSMYGDFDSVTDFKKLIEEFEE